MQIVQIVENSIDNDEVNNIDNTVKLQTDTSKGKENTDHDTDNSLMQVVEIVENSIVNDEVDDIDNMVKLQTDTGERKENTGHDTDNSLMQVVEIVENSTVNDEVNDIDNIVKLQTDTSERKENTVHDTDNSIMQIVEIVENSIVNDEVNDIDNIVKLQTDTGERKENTDHDTDNSLMQIVEIVENSIVNDEVNDIDNIVKLQTHTGERKENTGHDTDNSLMQVVEIVENSIVNDEVNDIDNIIKLQTHTGEGKENTGHDTDNSLMKGVEIVGNSIVNDEVDVDNTVKLQTDTSKRKENTDHDTDNSLMQIVEIIENGIVNDEVNDIDNTVNLQTDTGERKENTGHDTDNSLMQIVEIVENSIVNDEVNDIDNTVKLQTDTSKGKENTGHDTDNSLMQIVEIVENSIVNDEVNDIDNTVKLQTDTGERKENTGHDTDNSLMQVVEIVENSIVNDEVNDIDNTVKLQTDRSESVEYEKEMIKEHEQYSSFQIEDLRQRIALLEKENALLRKNRSLQQAVLLSVDLFIFSPPPTDRVLESENEDMSDVVPLLPELDTGIAKKTVLVRRSCKGLFSTYIQVIESGKGELIVKRRPSKSKEVSDYLPCIYCLAFYQADELWRHCKICSLNKNKNLNETARSIISRARLLLETGTNKSSASNDFDDLSENVMKGMKKDEVYNAIKEDELILTFGKVLLKKLGTRRTNDISQRMRQLGRLKIELHGDEKEITKFISGEGFAAIINALYSTAGLQKNDEGITTFNIPSLALRLGHNQTKLGQIKRGIALRTDTFLQLIDGEWIEKVSAIASATLKTNKFNKKDYLPITSDLVKLKTYLESEIQANTELLENKVNQEQWRKLASVTLAKIILFNKRRESEASKLLVDTFTKRPDWRLSANEEIMETLDNLEKQLMNRVPTLLTPDVVKAMELMVSTRSQIGINADNKFMFANKCNGHLDAWQVLQAEALAAGCAKPKLITSCRLRKYMATVTQVLDLQDGELEWLAKHLGHDMNTHKNFYRQHEATVEIAKVSKLLLAAESGQISKYKGKNLQEITLEGRLVFSSGTELPEIDEIQDDCFDEDGIDEDLSKRTSSVQLPEVLLICCLILKCSVSDGQDGSNLSTEKDREHDIHKKKMELALQIGSKFDLLFTYSAWPKESSAQHKND
ncbi:hypothetical protein KUTeg_001163 [Tegillarca granosa]|uniref:Uncharacterized protein n=1 Tax=Tegillarca granosa TaxID=220873 RepID=A0ABQ9FVQ5_TEGGR|nr:hypothetical protein KUTeg_001163 [Tegillarca granosa]